MYSSATLTLIDGRLRGIKDRILWVWDVSALDPFLKTRQFDIIEKVCGDNILLPKLIASELPDRKCNNLTLRATHTTNVPNGTINIQLYTGSDRYFWEVTQIKDDDIKNPDDSLIILSQFNSQSIIVSDDRGIWKRANKSGLIQMYATLFLRLTKKLGYLTYSETNELYDKFCKIDPRHCLVDKKSGDVIPFSQYELMTGLKLQKIIEFIG